MLRNVLVLLAAFGLIVASAGTAAAGAFSAPESTFVLKLGGLGPITTIGSYQQGGNATLSDNGGLHDLAEGAGIWSTTGNASGTSLFTGVNLITDLVMTFDNNAGAHTASFSAANSVAGNLTNSNQTIYSGTICPTGCLGGTASINGQILVMVAGAPFPYALGVVGIGGTQTLMLAPGQTIAATGGPWVTGKVRLTGITTNIVQLPNRPGAPTGAAVLLNPTSMEEVKTFTTMGGFITSNPTGEIQTAATVTVSGTNNLASASNAGQVTLVSPLRVDTGPLNVGIIPGLVSKTFVFAPEPGTLLLLASGAAGLVLIGRRRINK